MERKIIWITIYQGGTGKDLKHPYLVVLQTNQLAIHHEEMDRLLQHRMSHTTRDYSTIRPIKVVSLTFTIKSLCISN